MWKRTPVRDNSGKDTKTERKHEQTGRSFRTLELRMEAQERSCSWSPGPHLQSRLYLTGNGGGIMSQYFLFRKKSLVEWWTDWECVILNHMC